MSDAFYQAGADPAFQSTQAALDLALMSWLATTFFAQDATRVIYASNEFCFRERMNRLRNDFPARQLSNDLDFPFLNFYQTGEPITVERGWRSAQHVYNGVFIDELQANLQIFPVQYDYECSAFFRYTSDLDYAYDIASRAAQYPLYLPNLSLDWLAPDSTPTNPDNINVSLPTVLTFEPTYNPQYKDKDWLEKEHISSLGLDFHVQTFRVRNLSPSAGNFWLPTSIAFTLAAQLNIDDPATIDYQKLTNLLIDRVNQDVTYTNGSPAP